MKPCNLPRRIVFPAYAGMFLYQPSTSRLSHSFPRIRGDVPEGREFDGVLGSVFPAYAGMFLLVRNPKQPRESFPRIRGDVPVDEQHFCVLDEFSPHTRGCSEAFELTPIDSQVFPAYAGMFLCKRFRPETHRRFPRIRGDVPC